MCKFSMLFAFTVCDQIYSKMYIVVYCKIILEFKLPVLYFKNIINPPPPPPGFFDK